MYNDYSEQYKLVVKFAQNKSEYIHGWYPFVEGYSKEFIKSVIDEIHGHPQCCLDPFVGSGTTPLELQKLGIKCYSFEVNPFMHSLATTKMRTDYTTKSFAMNCNRLKTLLEVSPDNIVDYIGTPAYGPITKNEKLKKWNFHKNSMNGLLDIKYAISQLKDFRYQQLFKVALAAILLEVSNVYRNGKTYSYRENWSENINYSREEVRELFWNKIEKTILPDIRKLQNLKRAEGELFSNHKNCIFGDCRQNIRLLKDNSIDLVITSPPYLNSRDYTDSYMIELWMLDYIRDYNSLRKLRQNTFRSHVQVRWNDVGSLQIEELVSAVNKISKYSEEFWNKGLLNMINGYFEDLNILFGELYPKMMLGGRIYFNVANSAYYGVEIKTDKIVAKIAENNGFCVKEIRRARKVRPSSQQKDLIPFLWEVVLVIIKK